LIADISIRTANFSDAEELSQLVSENALALLRQHYSDSQWHAFISFYSVEVMREKIETQQVFCAIKSNEIIGTIALHKDFVVGFYTRVRNLGQGIGTLLMSHVEQVAKQQGFKEIQLAASPAAFQFYYKNGWKKVRDILPRYAGVEFEETLMAKLLDP
jgi:GNAT superfamily N-acetyltransferase